MAPRRSAGPAGAEICARRLPARRDVPAKLTDDKPSEVLGGGGLAARGGNSFGNLAKLSLDMELGKAGLEFAEVSRRDTDKLSRLEAHSALENSRSSAKLGVGLGGETALLGANRSQDSHSRVDLHLVGHAAGELPRKASSRIADLPESTAASQ